MREIIDCFFTCNRRCSHDCYIEKVVISVNSVIQVKGYLSASHAMVWSFIHWKTSRRKINLSRSAKVPTCKKPLSSSKGNWNRFKNNLEFHFFNWFDPQKVHEHFAFVAWSWNHSRALLIQLLLRFELFRKLVQHSRCNDKSEMKNSLAFER